MVVGYRSIEGGIGSYCLIGSQFKFKEMKKIVEMCGGGACITV